MKSTFNIYVFFLCTLLLSPRTFAQPGVTWDRDCDYTGLDIRVHNGVAGERCGGFCLDNSRCTHFVYYVGNCYLKQENPLSAKKKYLKDSICGLIPERLKSWSFPLKHQG